MGEIRKSHNTYKCTRHKTAIFFMKTNYLASGFATEQWDAYIKSMYNHFISWAVRQMTYVKCLWRRWSYGRVVEWAVTKVKRRKGWKMSCAVGEATKGSLQHEISRIRTFILVINYFLYQNKLFSILFCHGTLRRTGDQSGTLCVSLPHTVAMLIF